MSLHHWIASLDGDAGGRAVPRQHGGHLAPAAGAVAVVLVDVRQLLRSFKIGLIDGANINVKKIRKEIGQKGHSCLYPSSLYRVTHQVEPNLPLTSKQNFCFNVNRRFGSTWCVTLYLFSTSEASDQPRPTIGASWMQKWGYFSRVFKLF